MGAFDYFLHVVKNYIAFSGRARRKEYWFYTLFYTIFYIVLGIVDGMVLQGTPILSGIFVLGLLLPTLGVLVRRLHDIDKSGWWALICLVPLIGGLVLLIFCCLKGTEGENRFGADPVID